MSSFMTAVAFALVTLASVSSHAALDVSPPRVHFFPTSVGETSFPERLRVSNRDTVPVNRLRFQSSCRSADFYFDVNDCRYPIRPNGWCTIQIQFRPQTPGFQWCTLRLITERGSFADVDIQGQATPRRAPTPRPTPRPTPHP